ncbi:hypothetical protein BGX38DRAFT_1100988 [Terfezia claveryi]|nr:hypothetical protein BGX38DRAFT_1100988 [Terfezia claveryi]
MKIGDITAAQILAAAPGTRSCSGSGGECSSAEIAAKALNVAFATYKLDSLGQKAGMISYMAFESGGFKWNTNQFPGRPGQGTKCMLMFPHLYNFATSFPELQGSVAQNSPGALVLGDAYTFKGGPWYLTSYPAATCNKNQLNNGYQGFVATMGAPCFSVTMDEGRKAQWCKTIKAIKPAGMAAPPDCA